MPFISPHVLLLRFTIAKDVIANLGGAIRMSVDYG